MRTIEKVEAAAKVIKKKIKMRPEIAIILGTGLGALVSEISVLADEISGEQSISYDKIPYFPSSTTVGHKGELVAGKIGEKNVIALAGRAHYYEGYSLQEVIFPVQVAKFLGAKIIIVSNAAGGMNPQFGLGDLVLITDHINFMGVNPLIGPNDSKLGPRFPDMSQPYSRRLIKLMEKIALEEKMALKKGVYVGVTGPNLETAAEYRFMRLIGADMVGMSTVPEVIAAVHAGLEVLGISCITDRCLPDALKPADIKEILKTADRAEPKLTRLVKKFIERL